jgi:hypothetical protein
MFGGLLGKLEGTLFFFVSHMILVYVFATVYWILHEYVTNKTALRYIHNQPGKQDTQSEFTWLDYFYFSIVTQTTVGYGDIVTVHPFARVANIIQLLTVYGVVTYSIFG